MKPGFLLAMLPFGLIVAMASPKTAQGATSGSGDWKDPDAPRRIRQYAAPIEAAAGWEGLGDFLVALAFTESRGNPRALGDGGSSGGWFQMKRGARCVDAMGLTARELAEGSEELQVLLAACHARRLGSVWASSGQAVEWRDIRRGWAFPKWTKQSYRTSSDTQKNRRHFDKGIRAAGLPASFATRRTFPSGFDWPGLTELLAMI